eukprot:TRINITY_DN76583_c0_g1_i1.p1 TRINITY_DN76583_c0_g1~~TRINITY_DN76583_c0_g1_i1.p1  ORF type:complete len:344 (+),score=64.22 TRINITY_DN76583_c0_g1_i1:68-1099(+)
MAKGEEKVRFSQHAATCCAMVGMFLGIIFLVLGIWLTVLDVRFTPVYTAIKCKFETADVTNIEVEGDGVAMYLQTNMECENPNPYSLDVESNEPSQVYIGPVTLPVIGVQLTPMTQVGEVVDLPKATLNAESTGQIHSVSKIVLSRSLLIAIAPAALTDVPIKLDLKFDVLVDVSFVFGAWSTTVAFDKSCGMLLAGLPSVATNPEGAKVGPMTCADGFEELKLLPVSAAGSDGEMVFAGINMAPEEIEEGNEIKTTALLWGKVICFALAFIFLCICSPCCYFARGKVMEAPSACQCSGKDPNGVGKPEVEHTMEEQDDQGNGAERNPQNSQQASVAGATISV